MKINESKKRSIKYDASKKSLTDHLLVRNKILRNAEEEMGINNLLNNKINLNYKINQPEYNNFNFQNNIDNSMPNLNNFNNFNSFYTKNFNINNNTLYNNSFSNNKNEIKNKNANLEKSYKNLYLKTKNENNILINKNEINEQTIIDLIKDKRKLIKNNEKLEKAIGEYKKIINEKDIIKEADKNNTINIKYILKNRFI